jgi:hypothetical protein
MANAIALRMKTAFDCSVKSKATAPGQLFLVVLGGLLGFAGALLGARRPSNDAYAQPIGATGTVIASSAIASGEAPIKMETPRLAVIRAFNQTPEGSPQALLHAVESELAKQPFSHARWTIDARTTFSKCCSAATNVRECQFETDCRVAGCLFTVIHETSEEANRFNNGLFSSEACLWRGQRINVKLSTLGDEPESGRDVDMRNAVVLLVPQEEELPPNRVATQ